VAHPIDHGDRSLPGVALTFDDGPGAVTGAVLEVLGIHGAHATFNVLGERIAGRERLLQRVVREGHEIGVHGWTHADHRDRPLLRARGAARTARQISRTTGVRPRLFRPPFGLTNRRLQIALAAHGLRTVLWDVDPRDFEEPGAPTICDRILAAIRPGSIVLLHDDRAQLMPTADAVNVLLPELPRRGWCALTVSDVLAGKTPTRSEQSR
jgi:peptidoglycan/xylan/chitin deacetylase (PgdA/CDA1 family)